MPGPGGAYITPCDAMSSKILCNTVDFGWRQPVRGLRDADAVRHVGATKLTKKQLDTLAEWIACGAPEN